MGEWDGMNRKKSSQRAALACVLAGLLAGSVSSLGVAAPKKSSAPARLAKATRWIYWLQEVDLKRVASSPAQVAVIDASRDGSRKGEWTLAELKQIKVGGRLALAYWSVGEAEDYRAYWKPAWAKAPPAWLGKENPEWEGNYPVRYWDPAWKRVLLAKDGPLARLIAAGFDGVYLDRVDVFEHWAEAGEFSEAEGRARMAAFVGEIASFARKRCPGFLVIVQNAASVASRKDVLPAIDGLALEDTFYEDEEEQDPDHTREVLIHARRLSAARKPVLAVDYCRGKERVEVFLRKARRAGLVPYTTVRDLDRYTPPPK